MNVLQILPQLNFGGVETGTVDFAKYLAKHGHKSVVISSGGVLVSQLEQLGTKHYKLAVNKKSLFSIGFMIGKTAEIIQKEDIDIVHARSRVPGWIAFFAVRLVNRRAAKQVSFITTCHGHYSVKFTSRVMGWGKRVIVASNTIGRHMVEHLGVSPERLRLIPRGVDLDKFTFKDQSSRNRTQFTVGIIARITPLKGHSYFIRSMVSVIRQIPNLSVLIIGDAPADKKHYKTELENLVKRLGLQDCVKFLGRQDNIQEILSNLNLLVVSTIEEEAFGRVIIEAQACGVPVVATKVGGIVDVIDDGYNGILVPPKDIEAMAQAIVRLIRDVKLSNEIVKNAYSRVKEKFTLDLMAEKTLQVYQEARKEFNILIIKFSALGDIILISPSLKAIRDKYPQAKISVLTSGAGFEILENCPYIDEVLIYDYRPGHKKLINMFEFSKIIRRRQFDLVVDFQNNKQSHILSFLSFAVKTYGYDNGKFSFLLSGRVGLPPAKMPPVGHQFHLLSKIGIENKEDPKLELWPKKEDFDYVEDFLSSNWIAPSQRIVGINIGGSWVTKRLRPSQIEKLCKGLAQRDVRVIFTGSEAEAEAVNFILGADTSYVINACGKTTLMQLACLIKRCDCFITADSACLHIAAAMGVPTIAIFGPTDPARHTPPHKKLAVLRQSLKCSPCYKPNCRTMSCIRSIKVEEILAAAFELMGDKKLG